MKDPFFAFHYKFSSFSGFFLLLAGILITLGGSLQPVIGQQMVVDDAEVVEYRAFQLETWLGTEESWFFPAFSPVQGLEIGAAAVFTDNETFFAGEAKYMFRAPASNTAGFGLVAGALMAPFEEFYAYVPVTLPVMDERMILHANLGYMFEGHEEPHSVHEHLEDEHLISWGMRTDIHVYGPVWVLGEVFGANDHIPDFHTGLRLDVIPELLEMDFTYGNNFGNESSGMGFTVGLVWTPGPLRPR